MLSNFSNLSHLKELVAIDWEFESLDFLGPGVMALLAVMLIIEARGSRRDPRRRRLVRGSVRANLSLLLFNDVLLSLVAASSLLSLAEGIGGIGLLTGVQSPLTCGIAAFLLLDLAHYAWHWANHRWDFLWMFHRVHHSDLSMNASTAFRLHFMEALLTVLVKAVFIVVTGVNTTLVLCSEAIMALFVIFHHTNLAFPGEKWLSRLIVVPALHRVHHSVRRDEHDSNYGAVFSIWDRLFGTLAELEPAQLGIRHVGEQNFFDLLRLGLTPIRPDVSPAVNAMIAEAAYFKAEKRGFTPGMEMLDWLDAEREIMRRLGH